MIVIHLNSPFDSLKLNPAQVLAIGFASLILIGTILLNLPIASKDGESVGFINAFFTATSAVCVTGLVVVDTSTHWTILGKTIIICLAQVGGLGFMTLTTLFALIVGKRINLRERLVMQEALNQLNISGIVRLTRYILIITLSIEGIGALLLSLRFIPAYGLGKGIGFSIFHSIAAFCNAGFDLFENSSSLTPFVNDTLINISIGLLVIIGGLGYTVILDIIKNRKFSKLSLHSKLVLSISIVLLGISFISILLLEFKNTSTMGDLPYKGKILSAMLQSISTRSGGFNTLPINKMTTATLFLMICFMFIGGSPSGTAGGIKTTTIGVVILSIVSIIKGKEDTEVFQRRIPRDIVNRALAVVGIAVTVLIFVTMLLSITEPDISFLEIFFESTSAFATTGLSMGVTPYLSPLGKLIVSVTMFLGRLGPFTFALALARRQHKNKGLVKYPEEKIIVG